MKFGYAFLIVGVAAIGGCTGYSYTTSVGACRTADGGQAGLIFHSDTNCRERCDNDIECTGFVTSDSWCETHYIELVTGDGREEYTCYSKIEGDTETETEDVADETGEEGYADEVAEDTVEDDMEEDGANEENEVQQNFMYTTSVGACRTADGGEAGLKLHSDTNCRERCDNDIECTGFITSDSWCETHYIVSVSGDGREQYTCNSKIEGDTETEAEAEDVADETGEEGYADEVVEDTAEDDMGEDGANEENEAQQNFTYTTSVGACRTADGGEAGLILHSDTNCRERCDNDIECTGFVTADSWCETHYIESVSGDGREEFTCNSKIEGGDATEETGDDEGKTDDEDSLEFAFLKPIVRCITDKTRVFEAACTVRMTVRFSVFRPLNYSMIRKKTFDSAEICELSEDGYRATLNCKPARLQKKKQRLYLKLTGISETKRYVAVVRMNGKQYMSGVAELTV